MRSLAYIAAGLAAAFLIAGVVFYRVVVRPWVTLPDEPRDRIEADFAKVEALAALPEQCRTDRDLLIRALDLIEPFGRDLDDMLWPDGKARRSARQVPPWRDPRGLPENIRASIDTLVAWHSTGGGLGTADPCDDRLHVVPTFKLGELALATAGDSPDDPRPKATLHLSRELRTCGSFLLGMVGMGLARRAAAWAEDRGVRPGESFRRCRPTTAEVLPLLARHAVCSTRLVEAAFRAGGVAQLAGNEPPWYALGGNTTEREILMLKQYYVDVVARASKAPDDLDAMAESLELGDPDQLAPSLAVRTMAMDLSGPLKSIAKTIDAYDSLLKQTSVNGRGVPGPERPRGASGRSPELREQTPIASASRASLTADLADDDANATQRHPLWD